MISVKEETLQQALQVAGLRGLPKATTANSKDIWLKGIALVSKFRGVQNYCIVENVQNKPKIIQDFGPSLYIISIDAIYPYEVLDKKSVPDMRSPEEIVKYLVSNGHNANVIKELLSKDNKTPEQVKADKDIIKDYITQAAIKNAKLMSKEIARCNELRNYKDRITKDGKNEEN